MRNRLITCRYILRNGDQCTAEAVDPDGEVVLCTHHLARALELVARAKQVQLGAPVAAGSISLRGSEVRP